MNNREPPLTSGTPPQSLAYPRGASLNSSKGVMTDIQGLRVSLTMNIQHTKGTGILGSTDMCMYCVIAAQRDLQCHILYNSLVFISVISLS